MRLLLFFLVANLDFDHALNTKCSCVSWSSHLWRAKKWSLAQFIEQKVLSFGTSLASLDNLYVSAILVSNFRVRFFCVDAWKQSYHQGKNVSGNVAAQMNWTWVRSAKAMGITSFTTLFAFIMTAVSPIPMIETFGIFAAMMVLFNYLLIITFFPACLRAF